MMADAEYFGRTISSLRKPENQNMAPLISMLLFPYYSLSMYESLQKLKQMFPARPEFTALSSDAETMLEASRHSLKMLEDTKRGPHGLATYLDDGIGAAHSAYFYSLPKFKILRPLVTDLGVFRYNGHIVASTHTLTLNLGMQPGDIGKSGFGEEIFARAEAYGQFFAMLGARLNLNQSSFIDNLDLLLFNQREEDWKREKFYREAFKSEISEEYRPLLTLLIAHGNTIHYLFNVTIGQDVAEYTMFKVRFLTLYAIVGSISALLKDEEPRISGGAANLFRAAIMSPEVAWIRTQRMKRLRNLLMHYEPRENAHLEGFDEQHLTRSLIEIASPDDDPDVIMASLGAASEQLAEELNSWLR
jgi:hypothetical protein